jgi:PAS domain S-box-containing protein
MLNVQESSSPVPPPLPSPEGRDARLLDALSLAALTVDREGRVEHANQAALEFFGVRAHDLVGHLATEVLFAPPEREPVHEVLRKVLAGSRWEGELPVVGRDDPAHRTMVSLAALRLDGQVDGALLLAEDVGSSSGRAQRLAERLTRLARVTAELLLADDVEAVTKIVIEHMADAAGATVASLSLRLDEHTMRLIGIRGGRAGAEARFETFPIVGTPAGDSVSSGKALVLSGRDAIHSRYPDLEAATEGERSMVCLPLSVTGRVLGVATMSFPGRRTFDGPELEFFRVMSDTCAQALDRVQALADAADQASKLRFLAQATDELATSLDYESTLSNVAHLAVPWFADWCSIALGIDGELRTLAVAHVDPAKIALAEEFDRRYPPDPDAPRGSYEVFRTGLSELTPEITPEMIEEAVPDPEQRAMVEELNIYSAMSVPLKVNNRVLGVVTWVAGEHGRRFGPRDLAFGEDLARRAAVAIDNAQLHTEVRDMAVRLQRAVLPAALPVVPGWDLAAHYAPAGHLDAGGDFYDVVRLDEERIAVFVGDVMGKGVHAAAAMAQMRSAVRAFLTVDDGPRSVLTRLDRLFEQYEIDQLVTMVYAVLDRSRDELVIANAGHPAPIVLRADGGIETLELPDDVLLGAGGTRRSSVTVPFRAGDAVLIFTDGLIERRHEDIDAGQDRLLAECAGLLDGPLQQSLVELVDAVRDPTRDDDVAALVVRRVAA